MLFLPRPEIVRSVLKTKLYLRSRLDDDDAQKTRNFWSKRVLPKWDHLYFWSALTLVTNNKCLSCQNIYTFISAILYMHFQYIFTLKTIPKKFDCQNKYIWCKLMFTTMVSVRLRNAFAKEIFLVLICFDDLWNKRIRGW